MADAPIFNPEVLAPFDASVKADVIFRWALALAGAQGTIEGAYEAFKKKGFELTELVVELEALAEVRKEMVEVMNNSVRGVSK